MTAIDTSHPGVQFTSLSDTQAVKILTALCYSDADVDQDPLSSILSEQTISYAPQCYRLKLVDASTPSAENADATFLDSFFSFTASPVQSPSYTSTAFHGRQPHRPAPLSIPLVSTSQPSPSSPNIVVREFGGGDKVDRWIHGGGLEPVQTPMLVDDSPHEFWDNGGQLDWREVIDHFLQHDDGDLDDPHFPRTPDGVDEHEVYPNFVHF
ncbi:hypothetical protein BN946_scf185010.g42 [Trametes cinnabarina]|uniref:Uncharacterized protein n=1 Tax=Pycnoporus cinnabarinus TaxID=5643 RepID=A0A060SKR7_PYCCI|nr:hypothetical protein BN946_scf185010.g42 [Trametes cinnabarina]